MENEACIILTSVESKKDAMTIAEQLVEKNLAACVQISAQGESVYRWKGKTQKNQEYFLNIKSTRANKLSIITWLHKHHPYDIPEILCLNADASKTYVQWISSNTCSDT